MQKPELSIIIGHFKNQPMLELCLDSVKKEIGNSKINAEIIVSDGMTERSTEYLMSDKYHECIFIPHKKNVGYSGLVNDGLAVAKGDYILVLNYDIVVTQGSIKTLLEYLKDRPNVGMVAPKLLHFNEKRQQSIFRYYTPMTILARRTPLGRLNYFKKLEADFIMSDVNHDEIQTPDWVMGSSMMISRTALEKVGPMDHYNFFMYFEDVDWCRRFWHAGFIVAYNPSATMYHYLGKGSQSKFGIFDALFNKKTHWHIRSAINFFWKYRNLVIK